MTAFTAEDEFAAEMYAALGDAALDAGLDADDAPAETPAPAPAYRVGIKALTAYLDLFADEVRQDGEFRTVELRNLPGMTADCRTVASDLISTGLAVTITTRGDSVFVIISADGHDAGQILTDETLTHVALVNVFHSTELTLQRKNGAFVFGAVCFYNTDNRGQTVQGTHTRNFGTLRDARDHANDYFASLTYKGWTRTS